MGKTKLLQKAQSKINNLSFEDCEKLYNEIDKGNPMIDLIFDRMEFLDAERFDLFLG